MVNRGNTLQSEKAYRSVTRHVTHVCDMAPLQLHPVILLKRTVVDVMEMCKHASPRFGALKSDSKAASISVPPRPATPSSAAAGAAAAASAEPSPAAPNSPALAGGEDGDDEKEQSASGVAAPVSPPAVPAPTVPATSAFDTPESDFVTSSALYPPPTLQRLAAHPEREGGGVPSGSLEWMWLVGRFLGQAIMEQRLLDLPLSHALYKQLSSSWAADRRLPAALMCRLGSSHSVDLVVPQVTEQQAPRVLLDKAESIPPPPPSLLLPLLMDLLDLEPPQAKPMLKLLALAYHRFSPYLFPLPSNLQSIDGASVEDLSLDWTVPGSPELELVAGGSELAVTDANVHVWIWMVAQQMINEGVLIQLMCMQQGLRVCLDTSKLLAFYPHGQCFSALRIVCIVNCSGCSYLLCFVLLRVSVQSWRSW
jgi:hypothetical protein